MFEIGTAVVIDGPQFPSPDWRAQLVLTGGANGLAFYRTDIYRGRELMCQIVLVGQFASLDAAQKAAIKRVEWWLEDFRLRPVGDGAGAQESSRLSSAPLDPFGEPKQL